jgi:hypothetical protein
MSESAAHKAPAASVLVFDGVDPLDVLDMSHHSLTVQGICNIFADLAEEVLNYRSGPPAVASTSTQSASVVVE